MHEDRRVNMMDGCPLIYIPSKYGFSGTKGEAIAPFFNDPGNAFVHNIDPDLIVLGR